MNSFRYTHMVQEYNLANVRKIMDTRQRRLAALKTAKSAENYVNTVRKKIKRCFAPFPAKTALKPEITGKLTLDNCDIEKIIFQSRPGFYVTGNLYLPKKLKNKNPAVLGFCGHSPEGKAAPRCQAFCQALAQNGFVVFIIDPISQGERRQFFPRDGGKRPSLCHAHNIMGNQMLLTDDFFGTWRVWDAIRALDYLLSRDEIDENHIGVTGNSGGGTLSSFLAALDSRITMAAPSCYICSIEANTENEMPTDAEQNPPGILKAGLDHVDLLLAHAPRPTLILGQYHDFFSAKYTEKASNEMKNIYTLLGKKENAEVFIGPTTHGYSIENRQAMVAFFMTQVGIKGDAKKENIEILSEEQLNVTKSGTLRMNNTKRVFEFTAEKATKFAQNRTKLSLSQLQKKASKILQIPKCDKDPHYRVLYAYGYPKPGAPLKCSEFAVETEPGIQTLLGVYGNGNGLMHPPVGKVIVYVGHISSQDDVKDICEISKLTKGKIPLVAIDPRGIGQSTANNCGDSQFFHPYGADYMYAMIGDMSGKSYLGQRVFDIMRSLDFLYAEGAEDITLIGRGLNSISAAFAGLLHKRKPNVKLINYLESYQSITDSPLCKWPVSAMSRGILKHFDLPDVYKALGKRLTMESPWNVNMRVPKK
ncbi:MAG: acetylxylan esterase [Verrucomicrobiota bacterium]|nr:acetylxylan esterase [Verrucomicrobiota bacterium]